MFKEEKRVTDFVGLARSDDTLLDRETFRVGDAAELEKMDVHTEMREPGTTATGFRALTVSKLYVDRHAFNT